MSQLSLGATIAPEIKWVNDPRLVKPEQLPFLEQWLRHSPELVVDYEADGLNVRQGHRAFMAGFYSPDKGAKVVDFRLIPQAVEVLRAALPQRSGLTIAHNLSGAELPFSASMGFSLGGKLWDNQHAIFALDERQERGQKEYAEQVLKKSQLMAYTLRDWMKSNLGTYKDGHELNPLELEVPYSAEDVETAWAIYQDTKLKAQRLGMTDLILTDSELTRTIYEMESTGLKLDVPHAEKLLRELTEAVGTLSKELYQLVGRTLDYMSHQALYGLFFGELGFRQHDDSSKRDSLDDDVLNWFIDNECGPLTNTPNERKARIVELVSILRELEKLRGTYLYPWIYEHQINGFLLPHLNLNGARTRRLSGDHPNLQNIPIRSALAKKIREAIVAEEGFEEYSFDYSQIEYRAFVHYCNDPQLIKAYRENENLDVHQEVSDILGVDRDTQGKHMNFGILFGLGVEKLARKLRCSKMEAQRLMDVYYSRLPSVKSWRRGLIKDADSRGYVKDIFNARRHLEPHEAHKAVNTICQMTAADIARKALTWLRPIIKAAGGKMRLTIHDDVMFALPKGKDNTGTLKELKFAAENFPMFRVPIRVQAKTFDNNWLNTRKITV